jgi:osmotically-inducible protein OsmY
MTGTRLIKHRTAMLPLVVLLSGSVIGCASMTGRESAGQVADDGVIAAKVKTGLAQDPVTEAHRIDVDTLHGVVRLSGLVDSNRSRTRALEIARSVDGVKEVRDDLEIRQAAR